jgi:hypothetical protein
VRERYPVEVKAYRGRAARAQTALIVLIDADTVDVRQRHGQLDDALLSAGSGVRTGTERISHLIPKRSIETWLLCLCGQQVNEVTSYREDASVGENVSEEVNALYSWSRPGAVFPRTAFLHS